jgi:tetratricopeptide (TPR) repeat protein
MAKRCPHCQQEYAEHELVCPHCQQAIPPEPSPGSPQSPVPAGEPSPGRPSTPDLVIIEETQPSAQERVLEVGPASAPPSPVSAEAPPPRPAAPPTQLAQPRRAEPTMLASSEAKPTMLAPAGTEPSAPPATYEVSAADVIDESMLPGAGAPSSRAETAPAQQPPHSPAEEAAVPLGQTPGGVGESAVPLGEMEEAPTPSAEHPPLSASAVPLGEMEEPLEPGVETPPPPPRRPQPTARHEPLPTHHDIPLSPEDAAADVLLGGPEIPSPPEQREQIPPFPEAPEEAPPPSPTAEQETPVEATAEVAEVAEIPEEGEAELASAGAALASRPVRPRYGRRWLGGILLGVLLAGGGGAGLWYFQPELLREAVSYSPNAAPPPRPVPTGPKATLLQQALAALHEGHLDEAWKLLEQDQSNTPDLLSARGQVRWLKYLHQQQAKKLPLQADAPEVKQALQELDAARQAQNAAADLLAGQIRAALAQAQTAQAAASLENTLRTLLRQAQAVPADDPELKNLPAALQQLLLAKKQEEQRLLAIGKVLQAAKRLDDPTLVDDKAIAGLLKDLQEASDLARTNKQKVVETEKQLTDLEAKYQKLDKQLQQIDEQLRMAKVSGSGEKGVAELLASRAQLQAQLQKLDTFLRQTVAELKEGQAPPAGADPLPELRIALEQLRQQAQMPAVTALGQLVSSLSRLSARAGMALQKVLDRTALEGQLRYYQLREPLLQTPEERLETWLALFQSHEPRPPREQTAALHDAQWLLAPEAHAPPAIRLKALYLRGLIARQQGKYEDARQALRQAQQLLAVAGLAKSAVATSLEQALRELTEASAYFLPQAQQLAEARRWSEALAVLDAGLAALPGDGQLLALRSLVRLEQGRAQGQLAAVEKQVRADALAAQQQARTAAEGWYALGRLEEELGHLQQAIQAYRQALQQHRGSPAAAERYRLALARVLQRQLLEQTAPAEAAPAPPAPGKAAAGAAPLPARPNFSLLSQRLAPLLVGQPPAPAEETTDADLLRESQRLAEELLRSPNPQVQGQGYLLLGLIHSRQGKRTQGLKEYVKGLYMIYPDVPARDLVRLVEEHPAFQAPDLSGQPQPVLAERHFGRGLAYYWQQKYPQAEEELQKALACYNQDARYHYFLGLARLAQRTPAKREAAWFEFEQGARLEAENRPASSVVNASLERIQGPVRAYLDQFRLQAQSAPRR